MYSSSNPGELIQFRTVLLKKCQQEFENNKTAELDLVQREQAIECAPEVINFGCLLFCIINVLLNSAVKYLKF